MNIAFTRRLPGEPEKEVGSFFEKVEVFKENRPATANEIADLAENADVLVVTLSDRVSQETLFKAKTLKLVITFSVGFDHVDLNYLKERNILFARTPDVLTDATADLAFTLILAASRRLKEATRYVERGDWKGFGPDLFLGLELAKSTIGILGFGKIGQAVARRSLGFGMKVLYVAPRRKEVPFPANHVSLEEVLKASDVFSIHCPLTPETKGLIGRKELEKMKPTAVLVNTARGAVIDETSLIKHLKDHPEFSCGLDVFSDEPHLPSELLSLPNALCLPHIGSATRRARLAMAQACADEAIRFSRSEKLEYQLLG